MIHTNSSLLPPTLKVMLTWLTELFQASISGTESVPGHLFSWKTCGSFVLSITEKLYLNWHFLLKSQVSSTHLLTASVMSAPASLAVAKLFWPETETPKITLKNAMKMENGWVETAHHLNDYTSWGWWGMVHGGPNPKCSKYLIISTVNYGSKLNLIAQWLLKLCPQNLVSTLKENFSKYLDVDTFPWLFNVEILL